MSAPQPAMTSQMHSINDVLKRKQPFVVMEPIQMNNILNPPPLPSNVKLDSVTNLAMTFMFSRNAGSSQKKMRSTLKVVSMPETSGSLKVKIAKVSEKKSQSQECCR